jgi:hypothetical protein
MTHPTKALAVLLALVASFALAACGSSDEETTAESVPATTTTEKAARSGYGKTEASVPTVTVRDGEPAGGVEELEYEAGDRIRFRVRSNVADEVHVHGYDVTKEVPAGGSATISFPAEIEGIFEVEMHGSGAQIAELRVNP